MIRALWTAAALAVAVFCGPAAAEELWETLPAVQPLPAPASSGYVAHDGARIYYATFGKGPPVVVLHGGLSHGGDWGGQVPALAAKRRVILIDSRGHGRSSRDARPFTYELMESDVIAVMDAMNVKTAPVVGWSDGAILGLVMAIRHPERVERVFAFAANMDPSGIDPKGLEKPIIGKMMTISAADYKRLSPTPTEFPQFLAAIGKMWATEPNYTAADLGRIRAPVAIVAADHDEAVLGSHAAYLAKSIPGAKLIVLPGLSHFAPIQDPAAFNAAMLGFLDGR